MAKKPLPSPAASSSDSSATSVRQAQLNRSKKRGGSYLSQIATYSVYGILGGLILFGIIAVMLPSGRSLSSKVNDEEHIKTHNKQAGESSYVLGTTPFFEGMTLTETQRLWMNELSHKSSLMSCPSSVDQNIIDTQYDFRERFPQCVRAVSDQTNNCGSAYSFSATSSVADRLCQQTNGEFFSGLSALPSIYCYEKDSYGCQGGFASKTFQRGKTTGFITDECFPVSKEAPSRKTCSDKLSKCEKVKIFDYCISSTAENIKREIMLNGPVVALLAVHADLLVYKSGVYRLSNESNGNTQLKGTQAVKVIGWDTINATNEQYWIIENSWGESWGQNGFAWIEMNSELLLQDYSLAAVTLVQAEAIQGARQETNAEDTPY